MANPISHGLVVPNRDFEAWLAAARPYMQAFERVALIRSPAGNDLNRFRNISAVQAPNVWFNNDALLHIRRAYPMVVMVDVINAANPAQLATILQQRILAKDRYGENQNQPQHIFDRFVIDWPCEARPARIVRPFSNGAELHEGIDITAYDGAQVRAAAPGVVTKIVEQEDGLGYGAYLQITSKLEDQTYTVTYAGLKQISVSRNQRVEIGDKIARAAETVVKIVVQNPPNGLSGYKLPNIVDPTPMVYWQGLRVRPNVAVLRVRSHPGLFGDVLGTITSADMVETQETHGRTLAKLGVEDQWLRIRRAGMDEAYTAAWYLDGYGIYDPPEAIPGIQIPGMNLNLYDKLGTPTTTDFKQLGWVRLVFNVSLNPDVSEGDSRRYGNTDVDAAFNRYFATLVRYNNAGLKVILVLTHQTFGEGQGYVWPQMDSGAWRNFATRYAEMVQRVAAKFAGTNLIYAYQIWNEQDTLPQNARTSVPIPAVDYAHLLNLSINAIRSVDGGTRIITGGHITGPDLGAAYARTTLSALPENTHPDGIAFHPYGRGPRDNPFSSNGLLSESIRKYSRVMPGTPLWITEWGVLDRQDNDSIAGQVAQYATGFMDVIKTEFPGQIAAAVWYAWADGMDNGYGMVNRSDQPKQPLYDLFLKGTS